MAGVLASIAYEQCTKQKPTQPEEKFEPEGVYRPSDWYR